MKKTIKLLSVLVTLSVLASAGTLWADPVAPGCPIQSQTCFQRDGDFYCKWTEDVSTNRLIRGRAGLLEWVRMPSTEVRIHKCAEGLHQGVN